MKHKKHLTDCKMACLCKKKESGESTGSGQSTTVTAPGSPAAPAAGPCSPGYRAQPAGNSSTSPAIGGWGGAGGEERWRESPISLLGNWLLTSPSARGISKEPNAGTSDVQKGKHPKATSTGPAGCPGIVRSPITAAAVGTFAQLWYLFFLWLKG